MSRQILRRRFGWSKTTSEFVRSGRFSSADGRSAHPFARRAWRVMRWWCATGACVVAWAALETNEAAAQDDGRRRRRARPQAAPTPPPAPRATTGFRGPTRIDFDDRLIQGQTNKSGAVYLFDRKETGISSMVRRRKSFRHLTIETIYDR